jgi:hypothetical protein
LAAFEQASFSDESLLKPLKLGDERLFVWEEHDSPGLQAMHIIRRRDKVLSRKRWQFSERDEYYCSQSRKEG